MFGFGKRKKFLEENANFLSDLIGVSVGDAASFYSSLSTFDLYFELEKMASSLQSPNCGKIAQDVCRMTMELSFSSGGSISSLLNSSHMKPNLILLYTLKIGAEIIGKKLFSGTQAEYEIFKAQFGEFLNTQLKNASGEDVTLIEFAADPVGGNPALKKFMRDH